MKELNSQNLWIFELVSQEGIKSPIWVIVGFQQRDRQDSQNINSDTFYRPSVKNAQCIIGTKNPDSGILLNYDDDDAYSHENGQINEAFRALTKNDILKPYTSNNDFRSSNNDKNIGNKLYVFDIRYQRKLESGQPIKVEFRFSENIPAGIYGYALVLTNKMVSLSSNGQKHFDLILV